VFSVAAMCVVAVMRACPSDAVVVVVVVVVVVLLLLCSSLRFVWQGGAQLAAGAHRGWRLAATARS
jgi:hypothetical protein